MLQHKIAREMVRGCVPCTHTLNNNGLLMLIAGVCAHVLIATDFKTSKLLVVAQISAKYHPTVEKCLKKGRYALAKMTNLSYRKDHVASE